MSYVVVARWVAQDEPYGTEQDFVDHQATAHFKEFVLGRAVKLLQSRERVPFTILV
jgi:hypothetical protein